MALLATIAEMKATLEQHTAQVRAMKSTIAELLRENAILRQNELSLRALLQKGTERSHVFSRRKSVAIGQSEVQRVLETTTSRRNSLQLSDTSFVQAFSALSELEITAKELVSELGKMKLLAEHVRVTRVVYKEEGSVLQLHYHRDNLTKKEFCRETRVLVASDREKVKFWCRLHKFELEHYFSTVGRDRDGGAQAPEEGDAPRDAGHGSAWRARGAG